jgi:HPt (histidine-containing phosphotransfer) domain-containing protein
MLAFQLPVCGSRLSFRRANPTALSALAHLPPPLRVAGSAARLGFCTSQNRLCRARRGLGHAGIKRQERGRLHRVRAQEVGSSGDHHVHIHRRPLMTSTTSRARSHGNWRASPGSQSAVEGRSGLGAEKSSPAKAAPAQMPPLDLAQLRRYTMGNIDLELEILDLYSVEAPRMLAALAATTTVRARHDAAHTLKGSSASVGAWRVAAAAALIEGQTLAGAPRHHVTDSNWPSAFSEVAGSVDATLSYLRTLRGQLSAASGNEQPGGPPQPISA